MDRTEYLAKVKNFITAYKELQEFDNPNISPVDFIEDLFLLFNDLNHPLQANEEDILKILGFYMLNSTDTEKVKRNTWENISNHLLKITNIIKHSYIINKHDLFLEKLITEIEQEPSIVKEVFIRASGEEIQKVIDFLDRWTEAWKITKSLTSRISQATTEAVNNAILHGNKKDYTKKIAVTAGIIENQVVITVKDEGMGFDFVNIPATLPDVKQERGRGLFLIRKFTDELAFEDNGSKIILSFNIQPDEE